jgi:hypothetical protein
MTKIFICGACGQEMRGFKDQCPFCKVSGDNLVEKLYHHDNSLDNLDLESEIEYDDFTSRMEP